MINVALDAMGGDYAPEEMVKGAVDAVTAHSDIKVLLVGKEDIVQEELKKYSYPQERVEVIHASEIIETAESPVNAIRRKKDSSMVAGLKLVRDGKADALISAGNSGALMVGGQTIVGRIKGVDRAPFGALMPTAAGVSILIDSGANVDVRASHLVQFARMGSIYMEHVIGISKPRVGIVNIGAEEHKGNALVKETFPLLKACSDINFIGSVEARDIPQGTADVIVCDGFTGNVVLKMFEGVGMTLIQELKKGLMSNSRSKLGALLIKPALKEVLKTFDANQHGGAPILGLKGLVVKTHGNATHTEICNALVQCVTFKEQRISEKIQECLEAQEQAK